MFMIKKERQAMLVTMDYLLTTPEAERLYRQYAQQLPIIDFHNHLSASDIGSHRRFENLTQLWLASDPYKHRLMRICGIPELYITGSADPFDKFEKFCDVFPMLAGNPVFDWSKTELSHVFGVEEEICGKNARHIYDRVGEMLDSPEYSYKGILDRFSIVYQSPVAQLSEDISAFDGKTVAPSLRGDDLLTAELDMASITARLDAFHEKGCRFADHALDAGFFEDDRWQKLVQLAGEYAKRGWTLLLHIGAVRATSPRLAKLAGPAGGYAAAGSIPAEKIAQLLGVMEEAGGLPDTVLFPLNMADQAAYSVLQGSFSQDGVASKVQLGPAWWWCDHALGIENTLNCIASFGVVSQFIGMTTDSRSVLSFLRHDYFRRILCNWMAEQNGRWQLSEERLGQIVEKICYYNAYDKITRGK